MTRRSPRELERLIDDLEFRDRERRVTTCLCAMFDGGREDCPHAELWAEREDQQDIMSIDIFDDGDGDDR